MAKELTIVKPTGRYKATAHDDAREIFNNHAPYMADLLAKIISKKLESDSETTQIEGVAILAKFQKKFFKDQPSEATKEVVHKNGEVSEDVMNRFLEAIGRRNADKERTVRQTVVEADAVIVEPSSKADSLIAKAVARRDITRGNGGSPDGGERPPDRPPSPTQLDESAKQKIASLFAREVQTGGTSQRRGF